ncbi:unnamed protein product [Trichobilharzia szidati]|nr:unnamed protein product [Trichobilharzia szidati]
MTNHQKNVGIQPPLKIFLARAIYDNLSENPTELNFSRGDLVTVLDRNPSGLKGWWVCSIRGQLGIAPGNRLELLGLIHKTKERNNSDVYDDPTGWCISSNELENNTIENDVFAEKSTISLSKPATTNINIISTTPTATTTTTIKSSLSEKNPHLFTHNPCLVYENIDYYTKNCSPVGLTDSGNFSNRSSDVSFSIHSINDGTVGQRNNNLDSYEDYEDLPPSIPYEFRDTFNLLKQESRQLSPQDHNRTENEIHSIIESSQQQLKKDLEYSPNSQKKFNSVKMKSNLNWSKTEEKLLDSMSTRTFKANNVYPPIESNKINNKSSIELTPNTFNSVKDFTGYWLPIQGRIHDKCLNLMKVLHQSKVYSSTCPITSLFSQMDNEFIILSQLCTIMIGLSKQSSLDNGLTRKFIIYRQNMENLAEMFIKISKNCNTNFDSQYQNKQASQSNSRQIKRDNRVNIKRNSNNEGDYNGIQGDNYEDGDDKNLLEQTIQELLTEVNLFYTTILANSKILFNNSINKSPEIIRKISSPVEEVETKAIPKLSTPVPLLFPPPIHSSSSQSYLDNRKFLSKSHEFIDTLSPNSTTSQQTEFAKLQKYQNADFQKLSQLCLNALKVIDGYLNYLMQFQTDTYTGYSFSHNNCRKSLSIHSIVGQTKLVMQSCSELVRCTTSICNEKKLSPSRILTSSCQGDDIFSRNDSSTTTMNTNSSGKKLEHMADQVCEALKGLVTQTKETAKFITNDFENLPTDKVIPIPGPLLQRLSGALKSVQNSIETINKWVTSEYCQKKGNLKYLSSTHI